MIENKTSGRNVTKLAVIASHPVHYKVHLYRQLARVPGLDLTVFFCSRFGMTSAMDHTAGCALEWYDESILNGYPSRFLHNFSWQRTPRTFWGNINPGVLLHLLRKQFDAVMVEGYSLASEWLTIVGGRLAGACLLLRAETSLGPRNGAERATFQKKCALDALRRDMSIFLPIGTESRRFYLHHGFPEDRLVLSPYAVDNEFYEAEADRLTPQKEVLRLRLGIPPDLPVILFTGKLIPRKRCMDLLHAFRPLARSAVLVLVGDGYEATDMVSYVSVNRIPNVIFVGFKRPSETPAYFAAADIFALPSEHETWGIVVNEAMCFSLPIVTSLNVAATADLVRSGENGFLHTVGDVDAMTELLKRLLDNPHLRRRMGEASRRRIGQWTVHHSVEGIVAGIDLALQRRQSLRFTGSRSRNRLVI